MQQISASTLFLVLLTVSYGAAELSRQNSQLAASLGMLLGLPANGDVQKTTASSVPKFLMDVHDCWTALESDPNRASCLPVQTVQDLNDVNVVRALKGTASETNSEGFYSHSPNRSPLPSSLTYTFKMHPQRTSEEFQYAYIQISKLSITDEDLEHINNRCSGPVSLQLLSKLSSSNDSLFTPLSSATLNTSDFGRSLEVKFSGITGQFAQWQQMLGPQNKEVEMRLILTGGSNSSCYSTITPEDLGFNVNSSSNIVVFAKSDNTDQAVFKAGLNKLAAAFATSRRKRQAAETPENRTTTDSNNTEGNDSLITESSLEVFNMTNSNYKQSSCRLYSYNMSLTDLGEDWDNIISPQSYQANICAGSCEFPLTGGSFNTKHSYIQSLAARNNPEVVPPPCCVPTELRPLSVIYASSSDVVVLLDWADMKAVSCGCK